MVHKLVGGQTFVETNLIPKFLVVVTDWDTVVVIASEAAWAWNDGQDREFPLYNQPLRRNSPSWKSRWRGFKTASILSSKDLKNSQLRRQRKADPKKLEWEKYRGGG
jgi:hypothetical protein